MKSYWIITFIATLSLSQSLPDRLSSILPPDFAAWIEVNQYEVFSWGIESDSSLELIPITPTLPSTLPRDAPKPYLTAHFTSWLVANNYGNFGFERSDISGGSFGGKADDNDSIVNQPVIFIHGNGDRAMGTSSQEFNGFADTIQYLLANGYKESELYATTWGPADPLLVSEQYHSYEYLNYLRNFVEAVLAYTGAKKIDVVGHSMGVTLGRKVIKGGQGVDSQPYDLGTSLAPYVDTFLGIAGANWGLTACVTTPELPTCGMKNGLFPGVAIGPVDLSEFLEQLNDSEGKEGDYVFSMLSLGDDVILYGDIVYGRYTSKIPDSDATKIYVDLGHMQLKTKTCAEQLKIINQHEI